MKSAHLRWLARILRYGLIVVAVVFLYRLVTWYDYVKLNDEDSTRVRLIRDEGDQLVVMRDGREETISADQAQWTEYGGQEVLDVERGIANVVLQSDKWYVFWAVLIFFPIPIMCAIRLVCMLGVQQVRLSLWNSIKLTFAGNFFNFALPGTTGGDLIKAYYITRFTDRKTEAVTTVFLDRAVGLLGVLLMAGGMIVFTRDPSQYAKLGITLAVLCAILAIGATVVFSGRVRRALHLAEIVKLLPMSEQLTRIAAATIAMRQHKRLVFVSLLLTFGLQGICMISAAIMGWALGMEGTLSYFIIYVAIGFLIAAVPTTPQAIGVLETYYVVSFTYTGENSASQALALAVAVRLIQLVWSVPGVLVPLLGAHLPSREELHALETPVDQPPTGDADDPQAPGEISSATPGS